MALPLLTRASRDGVTFLLTPRTRPEGPSNPAPDPIAIDARMPSRRPAEGEQYRFHVDMGQCIGCKCCVVACNEQNGNPADINWRRVGEVEGGWYPDTRRAYFSMGCNHCLEPTCLQGCPVDAYTKNPATGIVHHSADTCIGCQYCTWNCSYGVPQFNPERGVVGKCDMCHSRLERDQAPACVSACPETAIRIEIVNVAEWRAALTATSPAPPLPAGMPAADASLSTTRYSMPDGLPPNARPLDLTHVRPAEPHWPLVVMTVLTQLSVGAFTSIWLLQMAGAVDRLGMAAITSLLIAGLALSASTLHLGRPAYAYRALKMWRRSWLSREVLLFTAFSGVANLYAALLWIGASGSLLAGAATVLLGCAGVTASAYIYRVSSRPAWNCVLTLLQFGATAAVLGPAFTAALGASALPALRIAIVVGATLQGVLIVWGVLRLIASDSIELRGTARLLSTTLAKIFLIRGALLVVGGGILPLAWHGQPSSIVAFALLLAGEIAGRYLFFVSVVPKHMTTPYLAMGSEAA
ncbi:MAG: DmsC/YnfH family molybdoenzyme membrane anchor subunit [Vicinamibacterales bacterium]